MTGGATIPTRLATALLIEKGEISLSQIRALPLVKDDEVALAIADVLSHRFQVEYYERRDMVSTFVFDHVIRLARDSKRNESHPGIYSTTSPIELD